MSSIQLAVEISAFDLNRRIHLPLSVEFDDANSTQPHPLSEPFGSTLPRESGF